MSENQRLKEFREYFKLTQQEIADILNVSKQYFYRVEKGLTDLSKEKLIILCEKYNLSLDWLLLGRGSMLIKEPKNNFQTVKLKRGQLLKVEYEE